jgi:hypothetical protein
MTNPYELWDFHKSLGVARDVTPQASYWLPMFTNQVNSVDEWIDFEKLPVVGRKLAPFVMPMASGKPIYEDRSTAARFKPAYVKVKDHVDPSKGLTRIPGIDSMLDPNIVNNPAMRREALKREMARQHVNSIQRRWEWLAAKAIIDGVVTIEGESYDTKVLDFDRADNQTIVLTGADLWTVDSDIFEWIQTWADRMFDAEFGSFPTRITIGSGVWAVWRKNKGIMEHMDTQVRAPAADVERGLISSDKAVKVGSLSVGGASGAMIEVWLYRDTYVENGSEVPFMASTDLVMTGSPQAINGFRCFGAIIDPYSQYQALDIFARNWLETGDPAVEYVLHQSAPLMVPVNPNATLKATVVE